MLSLTIARNNKNRVKKKKQLGRKNTSMKHEGFLHEALLFHHYSHDKATRPLVTFDLPPLLKY